MLFNTDAVRRGGHKASFSQDKQQKGSKRQSHPSSHRPSITEMKTIDKIKKSTKIKQAKKPKRPGSATEKDRKGLK